MNAREKGNSSQLTISEAVETLSSIAEMEFDREIEVSAEQEAEAPSEKFIQNAVQWLQRHDPDTTIDVIKDTFRVVLSYLRNFYKKEYSYMPSQQTTEGIKAIMVLVGEAAKKMDRYSMMFPQSKLKRATQLKEYKRLQEFYISRIARKIDEGVLSKWIMALSQRLLENQKAPAPSLARVMHSKHVFVDLESVKKDSEYELFFIRKEDGSRFFSPRIIRNIKLVCDFGDHLGEFKLDDPFESICLWRDHDLHATAAVVLHAAAPYVDNFYHALAMTKASHPGELASLLNQSVVALMLCNNSHNLLHNLSVKSCTDYFEDFQGFLRQALHSREYEKLIAYPPKQSNALSNCFLELTHVLCRALYLHAQGDREFFSTVRGLLQEANQDRSPEHAEAWSANQLLWSHLSSDYAAMSKLMKRHANGPLTKILDMLEENSYHGFDPMYQSNIPSQLFNLDYMDHHILFVRVPSPTCQEFIHKAFVVEEFKGLLHSIKQSGEKLLMINFQDRTSWREHARCLALEELQRHPDFSDQLTVATLTKDTEFFYQLAPYDQNNHVDVFLQHFKKHVLDENCGFFFPQQIKEALSSKFVDGVLHAIHRIFFAGKNVLTRERRLDFIEIFYLFLEMKLIELVKPSMVSFTCKDGADISAAAGGELYVFLKLLHGEKMSKQEWDQLSTILYAPAMMIRERIMLPERFQRMVNMIREIENVRGEVGHEVFAKLIQEAFSPFYNWDILNARITG